MHLSRCCTHTNEQIVFFIHPSLQNFDVNYEITARFPVHYAADYGQADVLSYLLSKGANANVSILIAVCYRLYYLCQNLLTHKRIVFGIHAGR